MVPHSKKKKKKNIFRSIYHEHLLGAGATRKLPIVLSLPNNTVASHRRDSEAKNEVIIYGYSREGSPCTPV